MAEMPIVEIAGENPVEDAALETEIELAEESSTEDSQEAEPKKLGGVAKRINELTAQRHEAERRAEAAEKREQQVRDMLDRQLQPKKPEPAPEPQKATTEPKLDQFATYEEYVAAVADYRVEQRFQRLEQERQAEEAVKQKAEVQTGFQQKASEFKAQTPDFEEVAYNPSLPITDVMADALNYAEKGPQLLYHLGKHPEEAQRIAELSVRSPVAAAIELGKLEERLSLPQPRTTTQAPPPIRPLSGGSGSAIVDPDKMTTNEWRQWREEQLRKR
jgi:hypothetical protein